MRRVHAVNTMELAGFKNDALLINTLTMLEWTTKQTLNERIDSEVKPYFVYNHVKHKSIFFRDTEDDQYFDGFCTLKAKKQLFDNHAR